MLLRAAVWDNRSMRRAAAAAIAVALQGAIFRLILHEAIEPAVAPSSKPLEVTIVLAARRERAENPSRVRRGSRAAAPPTKDHYTVRAVVMQPIPGSGAGKPAAHARIDWRSAMRDAVRSAQSRSGPKRLQFGFPRRPKPAPAAPRFGWDFARTHRVQALPEGGIAINISDRCTLVLYGLMLVPGCRIGRIPAHAHLFDHMHGRSYDRPGALP